MTLNHPILPQPDAPTLGAALRRVAASAPERPALIFKNQVTTFADLDRQIRACVTRFTVWGVRPGDRVAGLAFGHPLQLAALIALSEMGAIWVPLNFRLAPAEWQQVLHDCSPCCLLADDDHLEPARQLAQTQAIPLHPLNDLLHNDQTLVLEPDAPASDPHTPVLLVYTSGTTGKPKGAVHTVANLMANARAAIEAQRITPSDRVLTLLPLFHVGGLCIQTLPALLAGATVVLHPRFDANAFWHDLVQEHITLTLMVPAVMKAVIEHPAFQTTTLIHLRTIWAGSSVLPDALLQAWHDKGIPVCNVYGATETGPFSIALGPEHARSHMGSCGWPALGVEARLDQASPDGVGEVCLRGAAIVQRYWPDQPALDEHGWFHTGDLARIETDQSWRIVGRAKDMIISGGENIYPAEIEHILARHPAVQECAVVGLPDARWGEQVAAVVVFKPGMQADEADLLEKVKSELARYKHPRRLIIQTELPKTALGKVQKDVLIRQITARADTAAAPSANSPRSL